MFVCLVVQKQNSAGIFQRLINILTAPKVQAQTMCACGVEYLLIKAESGRKGVNWQKVERLAGSLAEEILAPEDVKLPPSSPLKRYNCTLFNRQVLLRSACELIDRTRMPMYRRILGLVDDTGEYADFLNELLKHYTSVKVVTQATDVYEKAAQDMMEQWGAPVFVGTEPESLAECVLILAPKGMQSVCSFRSGCPVLLGDRETASGQNSQDVFTGLRVQPKKELLELVPTGIDPHLFMGALLEYGGVQPAGLTAEKLFCNCKKTALTQAAEIIAKNAGTSALF